MDCRSTMLKAEAAVGNAMKSQSNMQVCLDVRSNCATIYFSSFHILRMYSIAKSSNVTLEKENPLG